MSRPVTQNDIARRVGVSRATVSNVLNDRPQEYVTISDDTRQRIRTAADELGYRPNAVARSLRSGHTGVLGLLIPDERNPHYWAIVRGVEETAMQHGYQVILAVSALGPASERQCLLALSQQQVDGLIVFAHYSEHTTAELARLRQQGAPIVPGKDQFSACYSEGMRQALAHLVALGHRRIAYVHGVPSPSLGLDRLEGYRQGLSEAGVCLDEGLIAYCGGSISDACRATMGLLQMADRPTAIIGTNDLVAIGALEAAGKSGFTVPRDLSIVGFDDTDIGAHLWPPLTSVHGGSVEYGRLLAQILLRRIGQPDLPPQELQVAAELIVRGSTGPCPQADHLLCEPLDTMLRARDRLVAQGLAMRSADVYNETRGQ